MSDTADSQTFANLISNLDKTADRARAFHDFLTAKGNEDAERRYLRVRYHCRDRRACTLAKVYASPDGLVVHQPAYKLSPRVNAASTNEAGREKNTTDGDRRWKAQTFPLSQALNLSLNCPHVVGHLIDRERVERDAANRAGRVVVNEHGDPAPGAH